MCTYNHIVLLTAFLRKSVMAKVRPDNISKKVMYNTSRDFHHKIWESYTMYVAGTMTLSSSKRIRVVSPTFPFVLSRFVHFPFRPESFRPRVVSPTFPFAPESFRPLSVRPRVVSPPYKISFLVLLFRPQKWYKALIFFLIGDFSLYNV